MTGGQLARLGELRPVVIAAMHGSAFRGDGESAIGELAKLFRDVVAREPNP
jgi:hypothetical protein